MNIYRKNHQRNEHIIKFITSQFCGPVWLFLVTFLLVEIELNCWECEKNPAWGFSANSNPKWWELIQIAIGLMSFNSKGSVISPVVGLLFVCCKCLVNYVFQTFTRKSALFKHSLEEQKILLHAKKCLRFRLNDSQKPLKSGSKNKKY